MSDQRTQENPKVETSEKDIDALIERIRQTIRKRPPAPKDG